MALWEEEASARWVVVFSCVPAALAGREGEKSGVKPRYYEGAPVVREDRREPGPGGGTAVEERGGGGGDEKAGLEMNDPVSGRWEWGVRFPGSKVDTLQARSRVGVVCRRVRAVRGGRLLVRARERQSGAPVASVSPLCVGRGAGAPVDQSPRRCLSHPCSPTSNKGERRSPSSMRFDSARARSCVLVGPPQFTRAPNAHPTPGQRQPSPLRPPLSSSRAPHPAAPARQRSLGSGRTRRSRQCGRVAELSPHNEARARVDTGSERRRRSDITTFRSHERARPTAPCRPTAPRLVAQLRGAATCAPASAAAIARSTGG
jgi:hypothetical protein